MQVESGMRLLVSVHFAPWLVGSLSVFSNQKLHIARYITQHKSDPLHDLIKVYKSLLDCI